MPGTMTNSAEGLPESSSLAAEKPRLHKTVSILAWIVFALGCFIVFTALKMPEEKIKAAILGEINSALAPKGISVSAEKGSLSIGLGISYVLRDVAVNFGQQPEIAPARIESLRVAPALLQLFMGRMGTEIEIREGAGSFRGGASYKKGGAAFNFSAKDLDTGKLGLLPIATGIQGSLLLNGSGNFSLDPDQLNTTDGKLGLDLKNIGIDAQSLMGFSVPRLSISDARIEVEVDKGHLQIKTLQIGKPGLASDDIQANITGDINLGRQWDASVLNIKARFSLSQNILKSFALIDALLGAGKQPDGSYSFQITGPVSAPQSTPWNGS